MDFSALLFCTVMPTAVLLTKFWPKEIGCTWKSKCSRYRDVLSLIYFQSQVYWTWDHRAKSTACWGPQSYLPMMVLKNHLVGKIIFNEIVEAQTILNKSPIMMTISDLLIEIGFGRRSLFMISVLDSAGSSQGASPSIVLCCWARYFTLTVPLSTQMFKWVLANLKLGCNHLMNLESHPGGVEILPVSSCFWNQDKLWPVGPLGLYAGFTIWIERVEAQINANNDNPSWFLE